jgi:hypothetical protein
MVPALDPRLSGNGFGQEAAPELMWPTRVVRWDQRPPFLAFVMVRKGGSSRRQSLYIEVQVITAV